MDRTVRVLLFGILLALVALFVQNASQDTEAPVPQDLALVSELPAPVAGREPTVRGTPGHDPELSLQQFGGALANSELPPEIRSWAATQVGQIRTPAAVEALLVVLDDDEIDVVRAAVDALAQQEDPRAREALVALRAHPDPWVSRRVGEALAEAD
ncbi:MAG: HEAT repeat domain-containing protein [Myxococcota bacterium]